MENYKLKKIEKFLKVFTKMEKQKMFSEIEIQKQKFYQHKRPISIKKIDINKIVISNNALFGKERFKYFIGYKNTKS